MHIYILDTNSSCPNCPDIGPTSGQILLVVQSKVKIALCEHTSIMVSSWLSNVQDFVIKIDPATVISLSHCKGFINILYNCNSRGKLLCNLLEIS